MDHQRPRADRRLMTSGIGGVDDIIRTSARALIQRGDELLVIRCRDEAGEWYVLPGGGQHHYEGLLSTLHREFEEETGAKLTVGPLRFVRECIAGVGVTRLPPGFHQLELVFSCELETEPAEALVPDPGQQSVEWKTVSELRSVAFFPQALLDAIEQGQSFGYLGVV
jgi:8-oxo-dGTP diphosphatase